MTVHKSEFGLRAAFFLDLERVFDADGTDDIPTDDLKALGNSLLEWSNKCEKALKQARRRLPKDHPVNCPISLFGTMDYGRLEVAHTRTLAWLLNPKEAHGFGDRLLKPLLRNVCGVKNLRAFEVNKVESERFYRNREDDDAGRTDIWIEGSWQTPPNTVRWLLVIEAKVAALEDMQQLARYDKVVKGWRTAYKAGRKNVYRVLLTPEESQLEELGDWKPLSFSTLAALFCERLSSLTAKPGYHFLCYYVAGVLKDILDLPIGQPDGAQNQYGLLGFLKGSGKR